MSGKLLNSRATHKMATNKLINWFILDTEKDVGPVSKCSQCS